LVNLFFCKEKVVAELKGRADAGVVRRILSKKLRE